jgi:hypothetical protein
MSSDEKHPIRNGIAIGVGTALILSALYFIPHLAVWIWSAVFKLFRFSVTRTATPKWVLFVLISLSGITILRFVRNRLRGQTREEDGPNIDDYVEDSFFDATWRWTPGYISSIAPFCPRCDTALVYHEDYEIGPGYPGRQITEFICEHCDRVVTKLKGDHGYAVAQVARQIDRKSRSGEWRQVVLKGTSGSSNK